MKSLQLPFPGRTAMLPLMMGIACLVTTPSARGQSISTSGIMYTGEDGESVEETISIAGNQDEIDGYVSVENESFDMEDTIEYVAAEADLYDAGNLVAEGGGEYETDSASASASAPTNVGDTYILDGWAYACFYVYEGDEGDCEPADLGDLQLQLQTGAPYISKIQPASADVGAQPVSITVTGEDLIDAFGVSRVSMTGGVNATIGSGESTSQATINYPTLTSSNAGQQTLTISNSFGASNGETFTVGYPSPSVLGVSPSTWYAGSTYTVTITGTNFGTSPSVSIALPSGTISPTALPCSAGSSDTCVTVTFSVPANCPSGPAPVTVTSNGFNGSGFFPGNSGNSPSNTNNSGQTVFTPPTPVINLLNGTTASPFAGQAISLSVSPPSSSNLTLASESWVFGNSADVVAGFVPTQTCGAVVPVSSTAQTVCGTTVPAFSTTQTTLPNYYYIVPGASETVTVTVTYNLAGGATSSQVSKTQTFSIQGPTGVTVSNLDPVAPVQILAQSPVPPYGPVIALGADETPGPNYGIAVGAAASQLPNNAGSNSGFQWVQLITNIALSPRESGVAQPTACTSSVPLPALDTTYPAFWGADFNDAPEVPLPSNYGEIESPEALRTYLMWDPALPTGCEPSGDTPSDSPCTSIPVPLGSFTWKWSGDAINTLSNQKNGTTFTQECGSETGDADSFVLGSSFPQWANGSIISSGTSITKLFACTPPLQ